MENSTNREHQQPPKVFGPDSALHRIIDLQDQTIRSLIAILADATTDVHHGNLKQLLSDYTRAKEAIENKKEEDIFNGRGDHALMEAYLSHHSTGNVKTPFPAKEKSVFPTLERLIGRILVPRINELFFTPGARGKPRPESGIYSLTTRDFVLVLGHGENHLTKMTVHYRDEVKVQVTESTCGNKVFLRNNVEDMIVGFFELLAKFECFDDDPELKASCPVKSDRLSEILKANLPHIFDPDNIESANGLRLVCIAPLDTPDKMIRSLSKNGAEVRATVSPAKDFRQQHVFTMLVDDDTYIKVTPHGSNQHVEVIHFSSSEGHWVSVKDHFPYMPQEIFYRLLSLFFQRHRHEPTKVRRCERET